MLTVVLGGIGMALIITKSFLFKGIRRCVERFNNKYLIKLFNCMMCMGFWSGAFLSLISGMELVMILISGLITSLIAYTWYLLFSDTMNKID
jgi:hypothetical protein